MPNVGASIATAACTSTQAPDVLEGDASDQVLDVDAAVAQRRPLLVGFGDLRPERDDAFQTVLDLAHADSSVTLVRVSPPVLIMPTPVTRVTAGAAPGPGSAG
jgi:hypothetical protein